MLESNHISYGVGVRQEGEVMMDDKYPSVLLPVTTEPFELYIDNSLSFGELVGLGGYHRVGGYPNPSEFRLEESSEVVWAVVLGFESATPTTEEVLNQIDLLGCRPSTLRELLAYGIQEPVVVDERPVLVIALGTYFEEHFQTYGRVPRRNYCGYWNNPRSRTIQSEPDQVWVFNHFLCVLK